MILENPFKTNQKLHRALLRGNQKAWHYLINHYTPLMLSIISPILGKEYCHESADIVQETFAQLCDNNFNLLTNYEPNKASLGTWLVIICKCRCIDWLRKKRPPTIPLDENMTLTADEETTSTEPLDYPKSLLSDREKTVMTLYFDFELTVKEIASYLSIKEQTVRSLRHKAISKLRDYFRTNSRG